MQRLQRPLLIEHGADLGPHLLQGASREAVPVPLVDQIDLRVGHLDHPVRQLRFQQLVAGHAARGRLPFHEPLSHEHVESAPPGVVQLLEHPEP